MITINDIWAWDPCSEYSKERIADLIPAGEITPQGICDLDIPTEDKVWALLHQHEDLFTDSDLHLLACDFAEQALSTIDNPDPRSVEAIRVKRLWVSGNATDDELSAALSTAWDAVRDTSWYAARVAARNAAWAAARDADSAAARNATWYAARDAAWYAAWNADSAAARNAAWYAAWYAAWNAQLKYIMQKLGE